MGTKELSEVAVEFNCILANSSGELIKKIPTKFIDFFKNIESKTYKFSYDKTKSLNEQELKPETRGLIALVYQNYICDDEERQNYIKKSNMVLEQNENLKREMYNPNKLFKKQAQVKNTEKIMINQVAMTEYKESIFKKIMNRVKSIFHIK